ncbi:hypothetical protein M427DRAFT_30191 [Gonapodya prolifera JEL478]|uniref:DM2 domain-containing protein n=1 Tax=Gonapodya prolifera (strain JEL478) TaxID=1344416 RepID=A0A139AMG2_GONPJ|nr:hypothetical protein M427DRAFT_30191 [Gonapodya prolifera JEL478]|eukprot:KXS17713.1 hypothetical protein M427DRAFT_30191 [Gonapodya prolifera JEL478]
MQTPGGPGVGGFGSARPNGGGGRGGGNPFTVPPSSRPGNVFLLPSGQAIQQPSIANWPLNMNQFATPHMRHNIAQAAMAVAQQQQFKSANGVSSRPSGTSASVAPGGMNPNGIGLGLGIGQINGASVSQPGVGGQTGVGLGAISGFQAVHSTTQGAAGIPGQAQSQAQQPQIQAYTLGSAPVSQNDPMTQSYSSWLLALPPPRAPRRARRPHLRHLPSNISTSHPTLADLYSQALETESSIDVALSARRFGASPVTGLGAQVGKTSQATLRVSLRTSTDNQAFQRDVGVDEKGKENAMEEDLLEPGSLEAFEEDGKVPTWTLEVIGEVLEPEEAKRYQFSDFIRSVVFELRRDPELYPDGNTIEWTKPAIHPPSSGFSLTRPGDTDVALSISLHLTVPPAPTSAGAPASLLDAARYKLSPALSAMLGGLGGAPGATVGKAEVAGVVWRYVKANGLWEPGGAPGSAGWFNCEGEMGKVFGVQKLTFSQLPERLAPHLLPPDPVLIEFTVPVDKASYSHTVSWDVPVHFPLPRPNLLNVLSSFSSHTPTNPNPSLAQLAQLDTQSTSILVRIDQSRLKRDFLEAFADDPATFITRWCESQARDLAEIVGERDWDLEDLVGPAAAIVGKELGDTLVGVTNKRERLERAVRAYVSHKVAVPAGTVPGLPQGQQQQGANAGTSGIGAMQLPLGLSSTGRM